MNIIWGQKFNMKFIRQHSATVFFLTFFPVKGRRLIKQNLILNKENENLYWSVGTFEFFLLCAGFFKLDELTEFN